MEYVNPESTTVLEDPGEFEPPSDPPLGCGFEELAQRMQTIEVYKMKRQMWSHRQVQWAKKKDDFRRSNRV